MAINLPPPPPQRPPSPTELSYTNLAKLATPFGSSNGQNSNDGVGVRSSSMPTPSMPVAPRTAPPASINVPHNSIGNIGNSYSNNTNNASGVMGPTLQQNNYYQTPQQQHTQTMMPMSAPLPQHCSAHHPLEYRQQIPQQLGDPFNNRTTPIEDRVSNIASKLQAMQSTPHDQQQSNSMYTPNIHSQQQNQHHRPTRMQELHQFIETLKSMQMAVSRTSDEHQRVKKSRALNALLSMFESIIDERQMRLATSDPTSESSTIRQLEQRIYQLEGDNEQLNMICQERDGQLQQFEHELQHSQCEVQTLTVNNEQLQENATRAQEQCRQEQHRAQEAELIASESENVRNGLLATYARLTEENVELHSAMADMSNEKQRMIAELDMHQQELSHQQSQMDQLTQQLQQKDMDTVQLERKGNDLNDQLRTLENLLQSANGDRQRLREELYNSQRNSTTASEQLMLLRDQFSQFRIGGSDSSMRFHGAKSSYYEGAARSNHDGQHDTQRGDFRACDVQVTQAEHEWEAETNNNAYTAHHKSELEEQQRRRILEMSIRKQSQSLQEKESSVQIQLPRIPEQSHVEFESKKTANDSQEHKTRRPRSAASISANSSSSGLDSSVLSRAQQSQLLRIPKKSNMEFELNVAAQTNAMRPKSATLSITDDTSSSEVDSIMRNHSSNSQVASSSGILALSQQNLPQGDTDVLDTKINDLDSLIMDLSPSSSRPSMVDSIMHNHRRNDSLSPESIESLQPYKPRQVDKESDLIDYFYNQMKLDE